MKTSAVVLMIATLAASVHGAPSGSGKRDFPPPRSETTLDWTFCGYNPTQRHIEQWTCTDDPADCRNAIDNGSTRTLTCLSRDEAKAGVYTLDKDELTITKRQRYTRKRHVERSAPLDCMPVDSTNEVIRCGE